MENRREGVKKRVGKCFSPGISTLAEICKHQKSSYLLIRRLLGIFLKYTLMQ